MVKFLLFTGGYFVNAKNIERKQEEIVLDKKYNFILRSKMQKQLLIIFYWSW